MDADGNAHQHVLWTFDDLTVDLQQVRPLQRLQNHVQQHLEILFESIFICYLCCLYFTFILLFPSVCCVRHGR